MLQLPQIPSVPRFHTYSKNVQWAGSPLDATGPETTRDNDLFFDDFNETPNASFSDSIAPQTHQTIVPPPRRRRSRAEEASNDNWLKIGTADDPTKMKDMSTLSTTPTEKTSDVNWGWLAESVQLQRGRDAERAEQSRTTAAHPTASQISIPKLPGLQGVKIIRDTSRNLFDDPSAPRTETDPSFVHSPASTTSLSTYLPQSRQITADILSNFQREHPRNASDQPTSAGTSPPNLSANRTILPASDPIPFQSTFSMQSPSSDGRSATTFSSSSFSHNFTEPYGSVQRQNIGLSSSWNTGLNTSGDDMNSQRETLRNIQKQQGKPDAFNDSASPWLQ